MGARLALQDCFPLARSLTMVVVRKCYDNEFPTILLHAESKFLACLCDDQESTDRQLCYTDAVGDWQVSSMNAALHYLVRRDNWQVSA